MNIFYVDLQSGTHSESANDTLLLLHGFPSSSADFQVPMLRKLQTKFGRIIAYDYPGNPQSIYTYKIRSSHPVSSACFPHHDMKMANMQSLSDSWRRVLSQMLISNADLLMSCRIWFE